MTSRTPSRAPRHAGRREAFTLVEILVSVALLSALAVLLMGVANKVAAAWQDMQATVEQRAGARAMLDHMVRELQQVAVSPPTPRRLDVNSATAGAAELGASSLDYQLAISLTSDFSEQQPGSDRPFNPTRLDEEEDLNDPTQSILNPHAIFWQAPIARYGNATQDRGRLAQVGYFVRWTDDDNNDGTPLRPQLCRVSVAAGAVLPQDDTSPSDGIDDFFRILERDTSRQRVNWVGRLPDLLARFPASLVTSGNVHRSYSGWFVDDVLALWIRPLDAEGRAISLPATYPSSQTRYAFDSRRGYVDGAGTVHPAPAWPAAIEISLVSTTSTAARQLALETEAIKDLQARARSRGLDTDYDPANPDFWNASAPAAKSVLGYVAQLPQSLRRSVKVYTAVAFLPTSHRTR